MPLFLCSESAENRGKGLDSSLNPLLCLKAGSTRPNIFLLYTCLSASDRIFMIAWFSITLLPSPLKSFSQYLAEILSLLAQSSGPGKKCGTVSWCTHKGWRTEIIPLFPKILKHRARAEVCSSTGWGLTVRRAAGRGGLEGLVEEGWLWPADPSLQLTTETCLNCWAPSTRETWTLRSWSSEGPVRCLRDSSVWHKRPACENCGSALSIWINTWGRGCKENGAGLSFTVPTDRTRGNGNKLKHRKCH